MTWRKREIMDMARESHVDVYGLAKDHEKFVAALETFAKLVREDALAQPEQEPVVWITPHGEGFRIRFSPPTSEVPLGWDALYTTQPQRTWVYLTDEEVRQTWHEGKDHLGIAKVLQDKFRSKNEHRGR